MGDFASLGALRRLHFASLGRSLTSLTLYIDYIIIAPKRGVFMRDDPLSVQSMDFAVSIINLVKLYLKRTRSERE